MKKPVVFVVMCLLLIVYSGCSDVSITGNSISTQAADKTPTPTQSTETFSVSSQEFRLNNIDGGGVEGYYYFTIKNNSQIRLKIEGYSAVFYSKSGAILQMDDTAAIAPIIVEPGETAYGINNYPYIETAKNAKDVSRLKIHVTGEQASEPAMKHDITNVNILDADGYLIITGEIKNLDKNDLPLINVVVPLFNKHNELVAIATDTINDLNIGESTIFEAITNLNIGFNAKDLHCKVYTCSYY
jgi:hypothetical protein